MTNNNKREITPEYLLKQVAGARSSLLLLLILTVVNLVMLLSDSGRYFLFSASVPYYLTAFGMGMDLELGAAGIGTFTMIALGISAVILVLYLLCWLLSKKRPGWFVVALVAFVLDTLALLGLCLALDVLTESVLDLVLHAWVIWELFQAVSANSKLKKMAAQEEIPVEAPAAAQEVDPWDRPVN